MSIFLDFDGTITVNDTVHELAKSALRIKASKGQDLEDEWSAVVKAYVADYKVFVDEYCPEAVDRGLEEEREFLCSMKSVELQSLHRVRESGLFAGISPQELRQAGKELVKAGVVSVRPGFGEFVRLATDKGFKLWIISVNWSAAFIEGVIDDERLGVFANEVQDDGSIAGPGILQTNGDGKNLLTNSNDKLKVMTSTLDDVAVQSRPTYYFGDSTTDMECLLGVNNGIIISDKEDSKLLATLRRVGKQVPHVGEAQRPDGIAWAKDYIEVARAYPDFSS